MQKSFQVILLDIPAECENMWIRASGKVVHHVSPSKKEAFWISLADLQGVHPLCWAETDWSSHERHEQCTAATHWSSGSRSPLKNPSVYHVHSFSPWAMTFDLKLGCPLFSDKPKSCWLHPISLLSHLLLAKSQVTKKCPCPQCNGLSSLPSLCHVWRTHHW